jgi:hypothetical protein
VSDEYDYDYDTPAPRMQTGTKFALILIGACLLGGIVFGIAALAHRSEPEPEAKSVRQRPPPASRPVQPSDPPADRQSSRLAESDDPILGRTAAWLVGVLIFLLTLILIIAWVVRDARARGTDGAIWVIVLLASHVLGLLVYLASRPAGQLVPCVHCGNPRLQSMRLCPVCGRGKQGKARLPFAQEGVDGGDE